MSIYDILINKKDGSSVSLSEYQGKVLLIVNSATHCGFTNQYNFLRELYQNYSEQGLVILDFPCNQFGAQASGTDEEIADFCTLNFNTPYEIFKKIDVNGENQSDLFKYLKAKKTFTGFNNQEHPLNERLKEILAKIDPSYLENSDIKWNFTKFIVNRNGEVVNRFEPVDDLLKIEEVIKELL